MKNVGAFKKMKTEGRKISMVTCYDYWSARIISQSRVDCVLVGDSAAMVMHGHKDTIPADIEMLCYHVAAVCKGAPEKFVIGDMPFLANRKGLEPAMDAVQALMQAGAQAIKIEGAAGNLDLIRHLVESGVPVMGHLGLTPQSVHQLGGFKVQGKAAAAEEQLVGDAADLESAGCFALVVECVKAALGARVSRQLAIPAIGIGAGPDTDGQVLVLQDMLGMKPEFMPKFVRTYLNGFELVKEALDQYDSEVKNGGFPSIEESYQ
jgi:3-methyl-2-oxobutanoate hydroxymethyltransferase